MLTHKMQTFIANMSVAISAQDLKAPYYNKAGQARCSVLFQCLGNTMFESPAKRARNTQDTLDLESDSGEDETYAPHLDHKDGPTDLAGVLQVPWNGVKECAQHERLLQEMKNFRGKVMVLTSGWSGLGTGEKAVVRNIADIKEMSPEEPPIEVVVYSACDCWSTSQGIHFDFETPPRHFFENMKGRVSSAVRAQLDDILKSILEIRSECHNQFLNKLSLSIPQLVEPRRSWLTRLSLRPLGS